MDEFTQELIDEAKAEILAQWRSYHPDWTDNEILQFFMRTSGWSCENGQWQHPLEPNAAPPASLELLAGGLAFAEVTKQLGGYSES